MDKTLQALFALLRAGLWSRADEAMASVFPLSGQEWERVFDIACQQTVAGIAFRGLEWLPEGTEPPIGLMAKWMARVDRIERSNEAMNAAVARLFGHFSAHGVEAVLQKGQGIAMMYPEPLMRESGDIDLYFPGHDGVSDPLEGITGTVRERHPDGSWVYRFDGIIIERHDQLVDIQRPRCRKYAERLIEEKGFERLVLGNGTEVAVPSPEVNLLLLSSHILKHAMGVGIGLRQICDYAVAKRYYEGRMNEEEMREVWRMTGLVKWQGLLEGFVETFLEESSFADAQDNKKDVQGDKKKTGVLLDIVLKGGNFGVYSKDRAEASRARWSRKCHTFRSFVNNMGFALRYAPGEWILTTLQLLRGQVR